jgi:hypothetical protein
MPLMLNLLIRRRSLVLLIYFLIIKAHTSYKVFLVIRIRKAHIGHPFITRLHQYQAILILFRTNQTDKELVGQIEQNLRQIKFHH